MCGLECLRAQREVRIMRPNTFTTTTGLRQPAAPDAAQSAVDHERLKPLSEEPLSLSNVLTAPQIPAGLPGSVGIRYL